MKRPNAEKAFFCRKGGIMKDRGMILILYPKTCPDIGSPTKGSLPEKKAAYFWTLSKKGGGGFNPNPKVLG